MSNRQTRREAFNDLPSDMQMLKEKIKQLEEHTGLLAADELNEDAEKAEEVVEETAWRDEQFFKSFVVFALRSWKGPLFV